MTQDYNRLTKINFNVRMTEASKNLATKKQVGNVSDLGNKNIEN